MGAGKKYICKKCLDIIQSMHRHDFKYCKCNSIYVDGGDSYTRMGWPSGAPEDWIKDYVEEEVK